MMCRYVISALGIVVMTASVAGAQAPAAGGQRAGGTPPAPMKNLQVLPKGMPQPEVVAIMRAFNAALGVQCGHCHIWTKPGDPTNDMAADTKPEKTVARVMMHMTNDINTKLASSIKKSTIAKVECATCHRGEAIPVTPPPPSPPFAAPAAPPAK